MTYQEEFIHDNVSVASINKKVNNILGNNDKRYYELKRKNRNGQIKKVPCFASGSQGSSIRNAITGVYNYSHKVGSFAEDLYFSVVVATGESKHGEPIVLFYENPEQFERHFFVDLDQETKKRWSEKTNLKRKEAKLV